MSSRSESGFEPVPFGRSARLCWALAFAVVAGVSCVGEDDCLESRTCTPSEGTSSPAAGSGGEPSHDSPDSAGAGGSSDSGQSGAGGAGGDSEGMAGQAGASNDSVDFPELGTPCSDDGASACPALAARETLV